MMNEVNVNSSTGGAGIVCVDHSLVYASEAVDRGSGANDDEQV